MGDRECLEEKLPHEEFGKECEDYCVEQSKSDTVYLLK
ncbi:hypothetical protein C5S39_02900 [Candidatus Methanophagaceae archaeon]|jgi:hypothetical protein|nr:hypothetical protein C5S39_02900 [Methanophagales archaeon]